MPLDLIMSFRKKSPKSQLKCKSVQKYPNMFAHSYVCCMSVSYVYLHADYFVNYVNNLREYYYYTNNMLYHAVVEFLFLIDIIGSLFYDYTAITSC